MLQLLRSLCSDDLRCKTAKKAMLELLMSFNSSNPEISHLQRTRFARSGPQVDYPPLPNHHDLIPWPVISRRCLTLTPTVRMLPL